MVARGSSTDIPLPGYETTFITRTEMTTENLSRLREKVVSIVKNFGGEVIQNDDWGKRKLAYTVKKETRGQYTYYLYTGRPGTVQEIERNLRISEDVIRFLSVKLDSEFDAAEYAKMTATKPRNPSYGKERERDRYYDRDHRRDRDDSYMDQDFE